MSSTDKVRQRARSCYLPTRLTGCQAFSLHARTKISQVASVMVDIFGVIVHRHSDMILYLQCKRLLWPSSSAAKTLLHEELQKLVQTASVLPQYPLARCEAGLEVADARLRMLVNPLAALRVG